MRSILLSLALLGLASPASAGVYNLGNPFEPTVNIPPEKVRAAVLGLRAVPVPPPGPLSAGSPRAVYLEQAAALERDRANGTLSIVDRASLGACYIRLGRARDAVRVLSEGDKDHFLIQANLASAYDLQGDLEVAVRHQERVLDLWPAVWATWGHQQRNAFRECEKYYLRLLRSRLAEKRRPAGGPVDVDPIFPGLRLIGTGENGEYEAGRLAQAVYDRIPSTAYNVTLQLVLWHPQDLRLYWLLGELLNAHGYVIEAAAIVNELIQNGQGGSFKDLMHHRKVLEPAAKLQAVLKPPGGQMVLLSIVAAIPRGTLPPIGIGAIAQQAGAATPMAMAPLFLERPALPVTPPVVPPPPLPFNWRHVTVGFSFGFLVAALIAFQWQEWRRRRGNPLAEHEALAQGASAPAPAETDQETNIKTGGPSSRRRG